MRRRGAIVATSTIAAGAIVGAWWWWGSIGRGTPAIPAEPPDEREVASARPTEPPPSEPPPLNAADLPASQRAELPRPAPSLLRTAGDPLSILVTDLAQRPLSSAIVRLYPPELRGPAEPAGFDPRSFRLDEAHVVETTGTDGRATWPHGVVAGCLVGVEAAGYALGWGSVTAEELVTGVSSFALQPEATVQAQLIDGFTGVPVAGASVLAWDLLSDEAIAAAEAPLTFRALAAQLAVSDRDGRVTLPKLSGDHPVELRIAAADYPPRRCFPIWPQPLEQLVRLYHGEPFGGRILDEAGEPIAGARVQAAICGVMPAQEVGKGRSADDGSIRFDAIPAAPILVQVSKQGFALAAVTVDPQREPSFEIRLPAESTLSGRTVDERGVPIAGARLDFEDLELRANTGNFETYADGSFAMPWIHRDHAYAIEARAAGHTPQRLSGVRPMAGLDIVLPRLGALRVRATDAAGEPLPRYRVAWMAERLRRLEEDYRLEQLVWHDVNAPDGRVELPAVEAGGVLVRVQAEGHAPSALLRVVVPPGAASEELEVALEPGATITGRIVTASGAPIAGATVSWLLENSIGQPAGRTTPCSADSDGAGRFTLRGLPPHPFTLRVTDNVHPNASFAELRASDFPRDLVFAASATLEGRVRSHWSSPESAVQLDATLDGTATHSAVDVRPDGTFRFGPAPAGRWTLTAYDYWSTRIAGAWQARRVAVVELLPGATTQVEIDLLASGSIAGSVRSGRAAPPCAQLTASAAPLDAAGRAAPPIAFTEVDTDGRFSFFALPDGRYRVEVVSTRRGWCGGAATEVTIRPTSPPVRAELVLPDATLRGEVVDADERPVPAELLLVRTADGATTLRGRTDADGRYELALPDDAAPLQLLVRAPGCADQRSETLSRDDAALRELQRHVLEPEARLELLCVDEQERPQVAIAWELHEGRGAGSLRASGRTDATGRALASRLPAGRFTLLARLPAIDTAIGTGGDATGRANAAASLDVALDWGETRAVTLLLVQRGAASVRVVDASGAALPGRAVRLRPLRAADSSSSAAPSSSADHAATSGADGVAHFTALPIGRWSASLAESAKNDERVDRSEDDASADIEFEVVAEATSAVTLHEKSATDASARERSPRNGSDQR